MPQTPEQTAQDLVLDIQQTFGSPHGKRVLEHLSAHVRENDPSFIPGLEPWQPAYRDGAKSLIKYIRRLLETTPNTQLTPTVKK